VQLVRPGALVFLQVRLVAPAQLALDIFFQVLADDVLNLLLVELPSESQVSLFSVQSSFCAKLCIHKVLNMLWVSLDALAEVIEVGPSDSGFGSPCDFRTFDFQAL
jgi:hypothetical protein